MKFMRFKEFVVRVGYPTDLDITQRDIANALEDFCEVNDCTVEVKETPQITEEQLDGMAIYNACAEGYDDNSEDENIFRKDRARPCPYGVFESARQTEICIDKVCQFRL